MRNVRKIVIGLSMALPTIGLPATPFHAVAATPDTIVQMTGALTYTPATVTSPAKAAIKASGTCIDEGLLPCTLTISGPLSASPGVCPFGGGTITGPGTLTFGDGEGPDSEASEGPDSEASEDPGVDVETVASFSFQDNFPPPHFIWSMGYSGTDDPSPITMLGDGAVFPNSAQSLSCYLGSGPAVVGISISGVQTS